MSKKTVKTIWSRSKHGPRVRLPKWLRRLAAREFRRGKVK